MIEPFSKIKVCGSVGSFNDSWKILFSIQFLTPLVLLKYTLLLVLLFDPYLKRKIVKNSRLSYATNLSLTFGLSFFSISVKARLVLQKIFEVQLVLSMALQKLLLKTQIIARVFLKNPSLRSYWPFNNLRSPSLRPFCFVEKGSKHLFLFFKGSIWSSVDSS